MPQEGHKAEAYEEHRTQKIPREAIHWGILSFFLIHDQEMERADLLLTAVNGWAPAIFASSVALSKKWKKVKEDNLAANSTIEVVTAKKKIETGLCGDKKKIFKQSIVGKEEQTTATKMERKKA